MKITAKLREMIRKHSAGATVSHSSHFSDLDTFSNEDELSPVEIATWVSPYYMAMLGPKITDDLIGPASSIPVESIGRLLGDFNWRTRSTGAMYAALRGSKEFEEQIIGLMLKSEVCYAGRVYVHALASFNTKLSVNALESYLDYYLKQPKLYFDQAEAMCALRYLDKVNCTENSLRFFEDWGKFVSDKKNWNLDETYLRFAENMSELSRVRSKIKI